MIEAENSETPLKFIERKVIILFIIWTCIFYKKKKHNEVSNELPSMLLLHLENYPAIVPALLNAFMKLLHKISIQQEKKQT